MKSQVRWHRSGLEVLDPKPLRRIRDQHQQYREIMAVRKNAEPFLAYQELSLNEFTMAVLNFGIDAMKLALERKTRNPVVTEAES